MRRRDLIGLIAALGLLRPSDGRGEGGTKQRLVSCLAPAALNDPIYIRNWGTSVSSLKELGWIDSQNVRFDVRSTFGLSKDETRNLIQDMLRAHPDVINAVTWPVVVALQRETSTVPITFIVVDDPVGEGFVQSIAHPGGNITGVAQFEPSIGGKLMQLLSEIAPNVKEFTILYNPKTASSPQLYLKSMRSGAVSLGAAVNPAPLSDPSQIEPAVTAAFANGTGGLVVPPDAFTVSNRATIVEAAARYRVPAIYSYDITAREGGLMSYSVDQIYQGREQAAYIDRILRGAKPADLPVQLPKKYQFLVNVKTATALGLTVPPMLLATADEVIE